MKTNAPLFLAAASAFGLLLAQHLVHAQVCPINDLDQFDEIARICCESSTGAPDCSDGFPVSCTRECSMLIEPFWTACGSMVTMFGDVFACDETELAAFAEGACHHTNVLFEHAAVTGCSDAETLAAWTDDVNAACCEQDGVFECAEGVPWTCDAECAIEFGPYWESCMLQSGLGGTEDMEGFAALYDTCKNLPPGENAVLMHTVNDIINDPWCRINTTGIISIDQANAPCSQDESAFCARTIESGLYTCEEDYCSTCAQAHACDHSCSLPCVGQEGGPEVGASAGPEVQACETDSSRMCDRSIAAGMFSCDADYCLTCPQAHACDNTCTLPCGETDDDMGHRRQMKNSENIDVGETVSASFYAPASADKKKKRKLRYLQTMNASNTIVRIETEGSLFNTASVNQMACPLVSFIDRAQEVEQQCCSGGECVDGLPDECMFDCGRFFTSFLLDCNQTIHDAFPGPTVREYVAFGEECSRMDPMSMVRAIEGTVCSSCGDNHTDMPLEECDWGVGNSYEPNSCRPGCRLPSCGDGVVDTQTERCDDGEMNAEDGDCLPDCQLSQIFPNSQLLTGEMQDEMATWIQEEAIPASGWELCYSSPRGDSKSNPSTFHSQCDAHPSTISIARMGGRIFGGYIQRTWNEQSSNYGASAPNWLFQLSPEMAKYPHLTSHWSYCNPHYWPTWGGGHCLTMGDTVGGALGHSAYCNSYAGCPGVPNHFCGTDQQHVPALPELEVWYAV